MYWESNFTSNFMKFYNQVFFVTRSCPFIVVLLHSIFYRLYYCVNNMRCFLLQATTYTTLMQVDSGRMETYIQNCPDPCPVWWLQCFTWSEP